MTSDPKPVQGGLRHHRRREPFVQVPSRTIRDRKLSFKARGLLAFLLDQPDGWDVRSEVIATGSDKDGVTAIRSALHELGAHGYYRLERRRDRLGGQFTMGTAIHETPVPEWAAEYAEFGGKAVPVMLQPDGSYQVIRKPDTPPDTPPDPGDTPGAPEPPESENLTPGISIPPESGFPPPEHPHLGDWEAGNPDALIRQMTQTETYAAVVADATTAATSPGVDNFPRESLPGLIALDDVSSSRAMPKSPAPANIELHRLAARMLQELPERQRPDRGTAKRMVPEIARRLGNGWMPGDLIEAITGRIGPDVTSPVGFMVAKLRDLDETPPPRALGTVYASWCGRCDLGTRLRADDAGERMFRCPDCHPLRAEHVG